MQNLFDHPKLILQTKLIRRCKIKYWNKKNKHIPDKDNNEHGETYFILYEHIKNLEKINNGNFDQNGPS